MAFSVKPILKEISSVQLAEKVAKLIDTCADSDSVKAIVGSVGAASMPIVFPALALVGMELLAAKAERKSEKEFKEHCDQVVGLLHSLNGNVDGVAEQLDDLIKRRTWVWARISAADQDLIAGRIGKKLTVSLSAEITRFLAQYKVDASEGGDGLRIYAEELLATLDGVAATQELHTQALGRIEENQAVLATAVHRLKEMLLVQSRALQPAQAPPDRSLDRDLVAAVQRIAGDAARGGMTARGILKGENPDSAAIYLALRREQLDDAQQSLNQQIDQEKIELDREFAAVAFTVGRIDDAAEALGRILQLLPDDVDAIDRLGRIHVLRGRLAAAEECYRRVLALASNEEGEAVGYGNLGNVMQTRGDLDDAEAMYRRALAIEEKRGRLEGIANNYGNLGIILQLRGDLHGAEAMCRKALAIEEKRGRLEGIARHSGNLGIVLQSRGDLDGAEAMYRRALAINEKLGRLEGSANQYANLGIVMQLRGDLDSAEAMHRDALVINEKLGRLEGIADNYGNLGIVAKTRGDLDGAEAMHRRALAINEKLGRIGGMAADYGNLGIVMHTRGDLDGAEAMQRKALAIDEKLGRVEGMARHYGNLGLVMKARGDLEGAEAIYRTALAMNEKLGRPEGIANQCLNLGIVMKTRGNIQAARDLLTKSRDLFARLGAQLTVRRLQGLIDRDLAGDSPIPAEKGSDWYAEYPWLFEVEQYGRAGRDDLALKLLYLTMGDLLRAGKYDETDRLLRSARTDDLSTDVLLGLLTATLIYHRHLPSRPDFFKGVQRTLLHRGVTENRILDGLG